MEKKEISIEEIQVKGQEKKFRVKTFLKTI